MIATLIPIKPRILRYLCLRRRTVQDCSDVHMRPCPAPRCADVVLVELRGNGQ